MSVVGRRVVYSGRVQGVGFRARAAELAGGFPVTGWVKRPLPPVPTQPQPVLGPHGRLHAVADDPVDPSE